MSYIIKGFFLGILLIIVFTLVLAPMTENLIEQKEGSKCSYICSVKALLSVYQNLIFIVFLVIFWFVGATIMRFVELLKEKDRVILPSGYENKKKYKNQEYKMPWEHKLSTVEDKA